ncbi:MAG: hypothetical protein C0501_22535 [Isosphaera sp.]|nr:hypothetical protein [Isosphaera sp.]
MTLPTADWAAALDRMTAAADHALADLDRRAADPAAAAAAGAPPVTGPLLAALEDRLDRWDAGLAAAAALAAGAERDLADREAAVERWHERFARWRDLIEQRQAPGG